MFNTITCLDRRIASGILVCLVWDSLVSILKLSNPRMTILHAKKWLRRVAVSWANWAQFPQASEPLCCPWAILRGTEPVSALTRSLLYIAVLRIIVFLESVAISR